MRRRDMLSRGGGALALSLAAPGLLRAQETWSFRDFGAKADGSDDAAAIEAALTSGETLINSRSDRYTCEQPVSVRDTPVTLRGGRIEFRGSGDGLSFAYGKPAICDLDDMEILSAGEGGGTGLTIATTAERQIELDQFRYTRMVRLGGGMVLGGLGRSRGGWARALHLDTVNGADIGPISIHGPAEGGGKDARWRDGSIGIAITGRGGASPTALDFGAMQIRNVETGVLAQGGMEGVAFRGPAIVNVRDGVMADWLQEGGRVNPRFVVVLAERGAQDFDGLVAGVLFHPIGDQIVQVFDVGDPVGVGGEARIARQLRPADDLQQTHGDGLGAAGKGDVLAFLRTFIGAAGGGVGQAVAMALAYRAQLVVFQIDAFQQPRHALADAGIHDLAAATVRR